MNRPQDAQSAPDPKTWAPPPQPSPAEPAPSAPSAKPEQPPMSAYDPRYKSPLVASFLSVFPGVGQIYVGYYRLGFTHAIVMGVLFTFANSRIPDTIIPLLVISIIFFWLYNIIDAGRRAALYNHALREGQSFDLPLTPKLSAGGGSMAGGIALIGIGGVFLMYTAFDFSMDWVETWWPLAPIAFGAYLVLKSIQDKTAARNA